MSNILKTPGLSGLFDGHRVLVTGSSRGIGAEVVEAFAACGAAVVVHYGRNQTQADKVVASIRSRGGRGVAIGADLFEPGAGKALVEDAAAALGGLDIVVHNAGGPLLRVAFDEMTAADRARVLQLNLNGAIDVLQAAIPHVGKSPAGALVVTTSVAVRNGGGSGVALYGAAKAALESLVRSLAIELAPDGVRINGIAPGYIETEIHDGLSDATERERYVAKIPARRAGKAEDCIGAYLFFASAALSGYITGQTLDVNGGMTLR